MKTQELLDRAAKVLTSNGNANSVFFTSDGCPFLKEHEAKPHAKTLKDTTLTEVTREEAFSGAAAGEKADGKPEVKVKALDKMNTEELAIEVAKRPGLTVPEKTVKKDVVKLIQEYDAKPAEETEKGIAAAGADAGDQTPAADATEAGAGDKE